MVNAPSAPDVAPFFVPFTVTEAPAKGSPFSLVTFPDILPVCAQAAVLNKKSRIKKGMN